MRRRKNIYAAFFRVGRNPGFGWRAWSALEDRGQLAEVCGLDDDLAAAYGRLERNGVAAALLPMDAAFRGEAHILQVMPWLPM